MLVGYFAHLSSTPPRISKDSLPVSRALLHAHLPLHVSASSSTDLPYSKLHARSSHHTCRIFQLPPRSIAQDPNVNHAAHLGYPPSWRYYHPAGSTNHRRCSIPLPFLLATCSSPQVRYLRTYLSPSSSKIHLTAHPHAQTYPPPPRRTRIIWDFKGNWLSGINPSGGNALV